MLSKEKLASPAYREARAKKRRKKYADDPEYRVQILAQNQRAFKRRYIKHPELRAVDAARVRDWGKNKRKRLRIQLFSIYGSVCACCGESEPLFLTLEHKNGGGSSDRRKLGQYGAWEQAIRENAPEKYEILCFNCNLGKQVNGGQCPHVILRQQSS